MEPTGNPIRQAILLEIQKRGKKMSVQEVRQTYADGGDLTEQAISELLAQGFLYQKAESTRDFFSRIGIQATPGSYADRFIKMGDRIVEEITSSIEESLDQHVDKQGKPYASPKSWVPRPGETRYEWRQRRRELKREIKDRYRYGRHNRDWGDEEVDETDPGMPAGQESFDAYRDRLSDRATHAWIGLVFNGLSWAGVSYGLQYINFHLSSSHIPWSIIPIFAWGIGVFQNFTSALRKSAQAREARRMPPLEGEALDLYKRINRTKDGLVSHASSTLSVSALLGAINWFTAIASKSATPWALIPIAALTFSFLAHAPVALARIHTLKKKLSALLGTLGARTGTGVPRKSPSAEDTIQGPYAEYYRTALKIKDELVESHQKGKNSVPLIDRDTKKTLEEYVNQVRLLAERTAEVDAILESVPMDALQRDKEALRMKEQSTTEARLKKEYLHSIQELENQEKSHKELQDQREILKLRLASSVNLLTQYKLETAKLRTLGQLDTASTYSQFKAKTQELTQTLEDLRRGYEELDTDTYHT